MKQLEVTQDINGRFSCVEKGATGACIEGKGASVVEAVGTWAIWSSTVSIKCNPPALLKEFTVANNYHELKHKPSLERS